jgi:hypothetical protein
LEEINIEDAYDETPVKVFQTSTEQVQAFFDTRRNLDDPVPETVRANDHEG